MLYIKNDNIVFSTYYFIIGNSVSKYMEHIKYRIGDFTPFNEEVVINEIICNKIKTIISLWKEDLDTVMENNEKSSSEKNSYYWLSYDGIKKYISMILYEHLE